MDEFKSEDELRPDSSDRRPPRQRKGPSVPKVAMSRQHMMIGVGILVLLLVVIGVGSALKSPTQSDDGRQNQGSAEKNIDLSGSGSSSPDSNNGNNAAPAASNPAPAPANGQGNPADSQGNTTANGVVNGGNGVSQQPQPLTAPPVAAAPTVAPPVAGNPPQHRIDLPGNMADALSQQGDRVNGVTEQMNNGGPSSTLPTAPATVAPSAKEPAHKSGTAKAPATAHKPANRAETTVRAPAAGAHTVAPRAMSTANRPAPAATASQHVPAASAGTHSATAAGASSGAIQSAPAGFYTLQLSSASQAATLNAYARKQQLSQYWVYETRREGKPWYVLVSGVYPTSSQAKSAVAQLPAAVQANKPWARQIGQVKQDQNK